MRDCACKAFLRGGHAASKTLFYSFPPQQMGKDQNIPRVYRAVSAVVVVLLACTSRDSIANAFRAGPVYRIAPVLGREKIYSL